MRPALRLVHDLWLPYQFQCGVAISAVPAPFQGLKSVRKRVGHQLALQSVHNPVNMNVYLSFQHLHHTGVLFVYAGNCGLRCLLSIFKL